MFIASFIRFRRQAPRNPSGLADPRSGAPVRHGPAPMPRMRWY
jgi:hypothetical protein